MPTEIAEGPSRDLETSLDNSKSVVMDVREIVWEYWKYRELLYQFILRDIRIRYKQAVMGFGWAIFMPMLIVLSGLIVRFAMSSLSGVPLEPATIGSIAVRALPWAFFVGAIGFANTSLIANQSLVTKIYFPREVLPVASVLAQAFDMLIGAAALALVLPFLGAKLTVALVWLPVLIVLLVLMTSGLALFLSAANLFFRDVKYIVQVMLTFGIFLTPVFFDAAMLGPVGAKIIMLNPLAAVLEGFSLVVMEGIGLGQALPVPDPSSAGTGWSPWYLVYAGAWALVGTLGASVLFHKLEFLFAEYV